MNKEQKQQDIVNMFDDIASTYDLANRVLSFGLDVAWRKKGCDIAFDHLGKQEIERVVDVATGTGDLLLHWRDRAKAKGIKIDNFVGVDPSVEMLKIAKEKVDFATFLEGKAQELPIENEGCEIISISYGIRNVVDRVEALQEFYRALKPGGMVVILEFTKQDKQGIMGSLANFYLKKILPTIGGLVSKNYAAYKYLPDSIEEFLTTKMLLDELQSVGFKPRYSKSFSMGISTLIVVQK